jgi:hypothetical protein
VRGELFSSGMKDSAGMDWIEWKGKEWIGGGALAR